jgi:hypothetical protein
MAMKGKHQEMDHALRAELEFKAVARRNRRLGHWLAEHMGLQGEAADTYAKDVVHADLEKPGDDDLVQKVMADVKSHNLGLTEQAVRAKMEELLRAARGEVQNETGR